ncbi:MAG: hypothetical protein PVJ58_10385 [Chromatiales bacterium]|jgi:hypothetical protein
MISDTDFMAVPPVSEKISLSREIISDTFGGRLHPGSFNKFVIAKERSDCGNLAA